MWPMGFAYWRNMPPREGCLPHCLACHLAVLLGVCLEPEAALELAQI
jgi:hypothetical protein